MVTLGMVLVAVIALVAAFMVEILKYALAMAGIIIGAYLGVSVGKKIFSGISVDRNKSEERALKKGDEERSLATKAKIEEIEKGIKTVPEKSSIEKTTDSQELNKKRDTENGMVIGK